MNSEKRPKRHNFYVIKPLLTLSVFIAALIYQPLITSADYQVPAHTIWFQATIQQKATEIAKENHISPALLKTIVIRESGWDSQAVGDHGESIGLVQIHLPDHPDVTRKEALDPIFALTWAAEQLHEGHCYLWTTCPL